MAPTMETQAQTPEFTFGAVLSRLLPALRRRKDVSLSGFPSQSAYNTIFVCEKERTTSQHYSPSQGKETGLALTLRTRPEV